MGADLSMLVKCRWFVGGHRSVPGRPGDVSVMPGTLSSSAHLYTLPTAMANAIPGIPQERTYQQATLAAGIGARSSNPVQPTPGSPVSSRRHGQAHFQKTGGSVTSPASTRLPTDPLGLGTASALLGCELLTPSDLGAASPTLRAEHQPGPLSCSCS